MAADFPVSMDVAKRGPDETICSLEDPEVGFQLFLDPTAEPSVFSEVFGFPTLPLIGNYSEDYSPALPMVLLSVPLIDPEAQLPPSVEEMVSVLKSQNLVNSMPLYVMIHSALLGPQKGIECGYLTCKRIDEFNMLFHPWLFSIDHVHEGDAISAKLHVGIFEPYGVGEAHVETGGVPFGLASSRPQILHDFRFSPNNLSVRWLDKVTDTPTFFSFGVDRRTKRGIVCLHILPVGDDAADRIRGWMKGRRTLRDLLAGLRENLPGKKGYEHVARLLAPLFEKKEWEEFVATVRGSAEGGAGGAGAAAV
jgi:hypothetical protein